MIYITEVHMNGGGDHEHIAAVRWECPGGRAFGEGPPSAIVEFIQTRGGDVRVRDDLGEEIQVGVVQADPPYVRTFADGLWTDNLMALPRY